MRGIYSFIIAFFFVLPLKAQIYDPVTWSFEVGAVEANEVDLTIHADIEEGWHLYSQEAGEGPISTSFNFFENSKMELKGSVKEGKAIEDFDPNFDAVLKFFKTKADFRYNNASFL